MWPKRKRINLFIEESFVEDSRPNIETIKRNIQSGKIPGDIVGKMYYVWVGPNNQLMPPGEDPGTAMAESIANDWEAEYGPSEAA